MRLFSLGILLLIIGISSTQAQNCGIRGQITDSKTGETLIGVNVVITGTTTGVATDLDGNYWIDDLEAGTYSISMSYISYSPQIIYDIVLKPGEKTTLNVILAASENELEEVVIQARQVENTANSMLSVQKKSINVQDGISAQEIARYGSSDAAESMKKVTGASLVDGKYIYVRGLGDRYTTSQLNGQLLPSTDPYKNSPPMDIIPAGLLDNIITSKTFTPDLPGNFTGGNVNITTKSFPDDFVMNLSTGFGYNDQSSFNNQFLTLNRGNLDWLGYDDGTKSIPEILENEDVNSLLTKGFYIPARKDPELANILDSASKSLSPIMSPRQMTAPLDHAVAFSVGNTKNVLGNPLGYYIGVNFKREFRSYNDGTSASYFLGETNAPGLTKYYDLNDARSVESPQLGGMINLAYKLNNNNQLEFTTLYNHDTEISSRYQNGAWPGGISNSDATFETRNLGFRERTLLSYQLAGEHLLNPAKEIKLEWGASIFNTSQEDPDLRFFANTNVGDSLYYITSSEYDEPFHFWRTLEDKQYQGKFDLSIPFAETFSKSNKLKFGGAYSYKTRDFNEYRFKMLNRDGNNYAGDADTYFAPNNTGIIGNDIDKEQYIFGLYTVNDSQEENNYSGHEGIAAGYGMAIFEFLPGWKLIAGARLETTDIYVASQDTSKSPGAIKDLDVLPSINMVHALNDKMNLRFGFSKTIARPNMRELAPFASFEFIGGEIYLGNPELQKTNISNFDARWEFFPKAGELIAVSAYYKNFVHPIILVYNPKAANPEFQFKNTDNAYVYGLEFEFRKNLSFITSSLKDFDFSTNFSYIYSRVDLDSLEKSVNQNFNPDFPDYRPFQGQSPYLVNANLGYSNSPLKLDAIVTYNLFGKRLSEVSQSGTPDIYERPATTLDAFINKGIGDHIRIRIGVKNILNSQYLKTISYKETDYTIQQYETGRTYSLALYWTIK
ncbi:MAG: TonB-dependent receptor [Chitinophagales bacterium]|nr:TonB-dependent receptor [Chitinophagales bacterium]MBP8753248.1 TonB-dependent receptor [Chitinophagales bacterium]MBP9189390.1 TonB-dependent receptor [Chitinophagales bacterium]MBP9549504.1 TonB-dependent receptor [Chitinophagales bacterium]